MFLDIVGISHLIGYLPGSRLHLYPQPFLLEEKGSTVVKDSEIKILLGLSFQSTLT